MKEPTEPHRTLVPDRRDRPVLTRRQFLRLALGAGAALVGGCAGEEAEPTPTAVAPGTAPTVEDPITYTYDTTQPTPNFPPDPGILRFFTEHEAATVAALTARLLPGTAEDPGAQEAGVVTYIDVMLAYEDGFTQPAYREGPEVRIYEGDAPPEGEEDADVIWVAADEIERYGYQSPLTPAEVYRTGLEALDAHAQAAYGSDFVDLSEDDQDAIVEAMVNDEIDTFEPFGALQFFHVVRRGTMEGMFSDPVYGGNRDKAGWRLVRYPGSQRAYLPSEIQVEGGREREPWGLQDLPPFNYSRPRTSLPASPARRLGTGEDGAGGGNGGRESPGGHGH